MSDPKRRRYWKWIAAAACLALASGIGVSLWIGARLVAPHRTTPVAPADLPVVDVVLQAATGTVRGWWIAGRPDKATVLLLHGIRADRSAMIRRARLLARHGYSVLMIDLPAHGTSDGDAITLGWNESRALAASRQWIARRRPGRNIAAIGVSLGGASILLDRSPCGFDAVVLEAVYPEARRALRNRLHMRLGALTPWATPLLSLQVHRRLGVSLEQLRPVDHIAALGAPVLVIAGGRDRHTTPAESAALFAAARAPKSYWLLPAAAHQDFERFDPAGYERHVIGFLDDALATRAIRTCRLYRMRHIKAMARTIPSAPWPGRASDGACT